MIETTFTFTPRAQAVSPDLTRHLMAAPHLFAPNQGDLVNLPGTSILFVVLGRRLDFSAPPAIRVFVVLDLAENPQPKSA